MTPREEVCNNLSPRRYRAASVLICAGTKTLSVRISTVCLCPVRGEGLVGLKARTPGEESAILRSSCPGMGEVSGMFINAVTLALCVPVQRIPVKRGRTCLDIVGNNPRRGSLQ